MVSWIFWRIVMCSGKPYVAPVDANKVQIAGEYPMWVFLRRKH